MTDIEIYEELISESFTHLDDLNDALYEHQQRIKKDGTGIYDLDNITKVRDNLKKLLDLIED